MYHKVFNQQAKTEKKKKKIETYGRKHYFLIFMAMNESIIVLSIKNIIK